MSIFKIKQRGLQTSQAKTEDKTVSEELGSKAVEVSQESKEALEPSSKSASSTDAAQIDTNAPGEAEKAEVMVRVDGPISRVFTDALNKILAVEGMETMLSDEENEDDDDDFIQVYCWKESQLNTEDVVKITNDISKHTERSYVIAVESTGRPTSAMGHIEALGRLGNVKVCYSLEKAVAFVKGQLK